MTPRGSDKAGSRLALSIDAVASNTHFLNVHRFGPEQPAQILAVHGLTGHGLRWRTLATEHLPGFSILAPDLLGHGRSSWEAPWTLESNVAALAELLAGQTSRPVVVVGHSFGCAVALRLAVARPDLVASLKIHNGRAVIDRYELSPTKAIISTIKDPYTGTPAAPDRGPSGVRRAAGGSPRRRDAGWLRARGQPIPRPR